MKPGHKNFSIHGIISICVLNVFVPQHIFLYGLWEKTIPSTQAKNGQSHLKKIYFIPLIVIPTVLTLVIRNKFFNRDGNFISPKRGEIVDSVYGLGTVKSRKVFNLKLGTVTGINKLFVREGDDVVAGQPLISFDDSGIHRAPFAGKISAVYFQEKESVFPQTTVLTLIDLKDLYIEVSLEQQGALKVKPKLHVSFSFESMRGTPLKGIVRSIFPNSGQFLVDIEVENMPEVILPGMTADVAIEIGRRADSLLIPISALSMGKALIKRGGEKKKIDVKIGILSNGWAEVLDNTVLETDLVWSKGNP